MTSTRRGVLGAALAAPLLAQFTGTASGATAAGALGTVSDGWVEFRWTPQAQALLDHFGATVEAVAPAQSVKDERGPVLRFPVKSGEGDPSLTNLPKAHGGGGLDGGVTVRTVQGVFQVAGLSGTLQDGTAYGTCVVNGLDVGHRSAFTCGLAEGLLTTDTVPLGQPMKVRLAEMPLRPAPELVKTFAATFDAPALTVDTVLGYVTAEGVYTPPKA